MENKEDKPRKPIPVSVVTYRVRKIDPKEVKRILGRDLEEALQRGKSR